MMINLYSFPLRLCATPDATTRGTRRQVLQRGEPPQRTASATHWLLCARQFLI